jgi:hypothetical protein
MIGVRRLVLAVPARDAAHAERLGRMVSAELARLPVSGAPAHHDRIAVEIPAGDDAAIAAAAAAAVAARLGGESTAASAEPKGGRRW